MRQEKKILRLWIISALLDFYSEGERRDERVTENLQWHIRRNMSKETMSRTPVEINIRLRNHCSIVGKS